MSEHDPHPHDGLLRQALRAEADGVEATPEMLERTRRATDGRTSRRIAPWLLAAAAVAIAVTVAAVTLAQDEETLHVVDDPDRTTTTIVSTSTTAAESNPVRPDLVALVRDDGMLMTVNLATGEEVELHTVGDPNNPAPGTEEGGPYYIDGVDLSPDGETIYFSTCCEPVSGNTYRIPVTGGEPELFAVGAAPRVSPDGQWLATGGGTMVIVTPIDGADGSARTLEVECCTRSLAWSPDGTQLAYVSGTGAPREGPQVIVLDWDGSALTVADQGKPDNPGSFVSWRPDGTLTTIGGDAVAEDRSLSHDRSYRWLLWVDREGTVREEQLESGDPTPIEGLPPALAADW